MSLSRSFCNRRSALKTLGGAFLGTLTPPYPRSWTEEAHRILLENFWKEGEARPQFVWENREDLMYHDLSFPIAELMTAPEFYSFMGQVWTFNKAMEWHRDEKDGLILCYSATGNLLLTGEGQVSKWHSDPRNTIQQVRDFTHFEKRSGRRRDCAVLPAFQFHLGQNPRADLTVTQATGDWQFCASIKGRSGPPLISSGWQKGGGKFQFELAEELRKRGYTLNFAEVHFIMGVWTYAPNAISSVVYKLEIPTQPAIVASLPVVRSAGTVSRSGVPIFAAALNERGERLGANQVELTASVRGRDVSLEESDGLWKGMARGLRPGDYPVELAARGAITAKGFGHLRVTDGNFYSLDKDRRMLARKGLLQGPLSGSYQGTFFYRDVGLPSERIVNGQKDWDSWDRRQFPGEHLHYWEALTEIELDERFTHLEKCGWDLLHLHQHWGIWERLDAGGRIAPHGAEQVALYMRTAAKHGLALLQSLSSYEYALHRTSKMIGGTPPWSAYVEAGFKDADWYNPDATSFAKMFHQYLRDFVSLFKEETALFGMTASGEGDHENGPALTNDVFHFVKALDKNHVFLAEPLFHFADLPRVQCQGFEEELFGERTYFIGDTVLPEFDLGVWFKFLEMGNYYMAEGSWPTPNIYTAFHYEVLKNDHNDPGPESWVGTDRYRTRLRDTYYLGLVHRTPILDTWDEQVAEDEHIIFRQVRELVDWRQPFMEPEVVLRVSDWSAGKGRADMAEYEKAFARIPLAYRYIPPEAPSPPGAATVIDAAQPFQVPRFQSEGGTLPDRLKERIPLTVSEGYCASYLWAQDQRTLLAYVYNTTQHTEQPLWISGKFHRTPKPAPLALKLQNFPAQNLLYRLYDLNDKKLAREGFVSKETSFDLANTDHDYFLLVTA